MGKFLIFLLTFGAQCLDLMAQKVIKLKKLF
jgi:hypothetical protein